MIGGCSARSPSAVAFALLVAGCGGGGGGQDTASRATSTPTTRAPQTDPARPPASVPQKATGPADAASARVIRAWSRALRRGDVEGAARYFSLPSKFQNGTPVLTIDIPPERIAINEALPCGGIPVRLGSAGPFTIVTFKLVKRVGGDCGSAVGATARSAIRVADRHIREWYRLPDEPSAQPQSEDQGPVV